MYKFSGIILMFVAVSMADKLQQILENDPDAKACVKDQNLPEDTLQTFDWDLVSKNENMACMLGCFHLKRGNYFANFTVNVDKSMAKFKPLSTTDAEKYNKIYNTFNNCQTVGLGAKNNCVAAKLIKSCVKKQLDLQQLTKADLWP